MLEEELKKIGIPYSIRYVEDDTAFEKKYDLKKSPNILVDGELVFTGMPSISDLREYFEKNEQKG